MTKAKIMRTTLFFLLAIVPAAQVQGNFFSRMIKPSEERKRMKEEKSQPPSGVTAVQGSEAQVGSVITYNDGMLYVRLSNNNKMPLVGLGVGNSPHQFVGALVADAIQEDKMIRLIDTAHASDNEELIVEGILAGVDTINEGLGENERKWKIPIHVVTKVWYTHLGYERTKIAVEESIKNLKPVIEHPDVDFKLHVMLHWPRCFDNIPWMNCEKEEQSLPDFVRSAGPDPSTDPDNAWKESWRMLEDLYLSDKYPIASIGVSNFHLQDLEKMDQFARIHPHVLQANVWSLLYDSKLVDYCHKRRIHVQVYNAMAGTVMKPDVAPRAFHHIQKIAYELSEDAGWMITPAQVILAWLIQHGVSVIPRTGKLGRLYENSGLALANIPGLNDHQVEMVAHAVEAYLSGDDFEQDIHVSVSFHAVNKDIVLSWQGDDGEEVHVAYIQVGEVFNESTYPGHVFRTYDALNKDVWIEHKIEANFGDHKSVHVEL